MNSLVKNIGKTPIVQLNKLAGKNIFVNLAYLNPSGSIKDVMAKYIIEKAEKKGELKKGTTILEATSGNTGVSFAMLCAIKGYKFVAIMPENLSLERVTMMKAYGAKVILTPAKKDMAGAVEKLNYLLKTMKNVWSPKQFENEDNIRAHELINGREIARTLGKVDVIITGVGTGGTLIGTARALKKINPDLKVVAIEPYESAVLSGKKPGVHNIQGIGEGFIPDLMKKEHFDLILPIKTKDAERMAVKIAKKEGLFVGICSGANLLGAIKASKIFGKNKKIVTYFTDNGARYFSTGIFGK
ncbi:MAG: PLP-dependent cysteine synthase family protein [Candidatus Iainarchaeum sp.]|jgi:cysteine synthase A